MAAKEKFKVLGMNVELWDTSFRIEGMSSTLHVGEHANRQSIEQMIHAIHRHVESKAIKSGKEKIKIHMAKVISNLVD